MAQAPRTTGTAKNAQAIADNLAEAQELFARAQSALRDAVAAIEKGEAEAELKTPPLKNIQGAISLTQSALSGEAHSWSLYATARQRRY